MRLPQNGAIGGWPGWPASTPSSPRSDALSLNAGFPGTLSHLVCLSCGRAITFLQVTGGSPELHLTDY
jgi:hypothetical protein